MKNVLLILAMVLFLQSTSRVWVCVWFKLNQAEIAATLCVQKDIEDNACQGCCHLKKQLDSAEEEKPINPRASSKEKSPLPYCTNDSQTLFSIFFAPRQRLADFESPLSPSDYIRDIFHPPKAAQA